MTLVVTNIAASFVRREERPVVPEVLLGKWRGSEGEATLDVRQKDVLVRKNNKRHVCDVDEVVIYYEGPFLGYLFGDRKFAVLCDKTSTKEYQTSIDFQAPADYRKAYYFTVPDVTGLIYVEETVYMSKGYEDSEGSYVWTVGYFYH